MVSKILMIIVSIIVSLSVAVFFLSLIILLIRQLFGTRGKNIDSILTKATILSLTVLIFILMLLKIGEVTIEVPNINLWNFPIIDV